VIAHPVTAEPVLGALTRALVERFHPDCIILFGSRARGDAREDSDYDLAVVIDAERTRDLRMAMEAEVRGAAKVSVHVHLRRPGEIEATADDPGYVDWDIVREGVTLYTSPSRSRHVRERRPGRSSVDAWLAMARVDLVMIENSLRGAEVPWTGIAFHAQQAAEKYVKAAIIARAVRPQRTHNLVELFDHLVSLSASVPDLRAECQRLTPFAIDTRYPDKEDELPAVVDAETGERAVAAMRVIVAAVAP
jgi:HEPN domain-containing protein/predicted nucleotidyltransferase